MSKFGCCLLQQYALVVLKLLPSCSASHICNKSLSTKTDFILINYILYIMSAKIQNNILNIALYAINIQHRDRNLVFCSFEASKILRFSKNKGKICFFRKLDLSLHLKSKRSLYIAKLGKKKNRARF